MDDDSKEEISWSEFDFDPWRERNEMDVLPIGHGINRWSEGLFGKPLTAVELQEVLQTLTICMRSVLQSVQDRLMRSDTSATITISFEFLLPAIPV